MFGLALPKLAGGLLWKGGAVLAIIATLVVSAFLIKSTIENRQILKDKAALSQAINDPATGYIARLTTARLNVVSLQTAVQRQNTEFTRQSNEAKAELERLRKQLRVAQAQSAAYERRVNQLLGRSIEGDTLEERVKDVDEQVLEDLKR